MRVLTYTVAVPMLAALAFAQDAPPAEPKQPAAKSSAKSNTQATDRPQEMQEMKTQTYSGTLMDASCANSASGGTTSTSATSSTSSGAASTSSADRSAGSGSCAVSASTTQFALKMKDGNTVRFDDVGNARAQEAMKAHKRWSESASANKPVRVKASGVLNGDKLTVVSID
ncbi:MAG: hypothetical protein JWP63_2190 [Candidatus Solibacter sp.]|jgi:hypothetical protein|nr:hypothetical protein [Candidatus Solibacter sp.]